MNKSIPENFCLTRPLVLVGMMGAGKTSLGRALAKLLNVPFYDADREIEAASRTSVSQIFSDYGEDEFRRMERLVIARLLTNGGCVLSVGGGAFIDDQTRARIKSGAFSIWLRVDRKVLLERVLRRDARPLLQGGDAEAKLNSLLDAREPLYAQADLTVSCDDRPVSVNARSIRDFVQAALTSRTA